MVMPLKVHTASRLRYAAATRRDGRKLREFTLREFAFDGLLDDLCREPIAEVSVADQFRPRIRHSARPTLVRQLLHQLALVSAESCGRQHFEFI